MHITKKGDIYIKIPKGGPYEKSLLRLRPDNDKESPGVEMLLLYIGATFDTPSIFPIPSM